MLVGANLAAKVQVYAIHMRLSTTDSKFYKTFFHHWHSAAKQAKALTLAILSSLLK
jgi:hypothetical protein